MLHLKSSEILSRCKGLVKLPLQTKQVILIAFTKLLEEVDMPDCEGKNHFYVWLETYISAPQRLKHSSHWWNLLLMEMALLPEEELLPSKEDFKLQTTSLKSVLGINPQSHFLVGLSLQGTWCPGICPLPRKRKNKQTHCFNPSVAHLPSDEIQKEASLQLEIKVIPFHVQAHRGLTKWLLQRVSC